MSKFTAANYESLYHAPDRIRAVKKPAMVGLRSPEPSLGYSQLRINKVYNENAKLRGYELIIRTRDSSVMIPLNGGNEVTELLQAGIPMSNITVKD